MRASEWVLLAVVSVLISFGLGMACAGSVLQYQLCHLHEARTGERHDWSLWRGCQPAVRKAQVSAWT